MFCHVISGYVLLGYIRKTGLGNISSCYVKLVRVRSGEARRGQIMSGYFRLCQVSSGYFMLGKFVLG
jgi:hypothetical protein